ncbi:response regulator [Candidatus Halobeggiatoa sp. HSG11]|nr:response regulator [Candidatus Halobeggiatoa sp. HSG11]
MKIKTKLLIAFLSILAVMLIAGSFSIIGIEKLYKENVQLGTKNAPLADAAMEIQLTATIAHLWFEEIIIGIEDKEVIKRVWQLLDKSIWYADAILKGGTNSKGTFYPVNDPTIEKQIISVKQDINTFIKNAHLRFDNNFGKKELDDQDLDDKFDQIFNRFITTADAVEEMFRAKMLEDAKRMKSHANTSWWIIVIINILGIILAIFAVYYISREIMLQVGGEPYEIAGITNKVASGNLDIHFDSKKATGIYAAIQAMVKNLQNMTSERETQDWFKTGQTQLNKQMSGEQDIVQLTENIINFLTPYLDAQVGAFYLLKDSTEDEQSYLKMLASHAYIWRKNSTYEFKIGESIVGQAALERKLFVTNKAPDDYIPIQSGLGETAPRAILVAPFLYEDSLKGVIELASFNSFTDIQLEFISQILPMIAIAINTAESRTKMQSLLKQSQIQAGELQNNQEELQQTNEELQSQTEKLQSQQEALHQRNDELKSRGQKLKRQQQDIQIKNTELEKTKVAIQIKADELEIASKYKSEFLANMSHELRSPLNSMLILAQLLTDNKDNNLSQQQVEYASTIHSSGNELLKIINDILDLSKVEAGKIEINKEEFAIAGLITSIEHKFRHVADEKNLQLTLNLAEDLPANLYTDEQRLQQVITNLLSNAFKFTHEGGITLNIQRPTSEVDLSRSKLNPQETIAIIVTDTGIGIPIDKQKVIFEAFQQVDGTTSRRYGGTGLGLSISRQLIQLIGGEIQLHSGGEGQGCTFSLYIPIKHSTNAKPTKLETPSDQPKPTIVSSTISPTVSNLHSQEPLIDDRDNLQPTDKSILIIEDDRNFAKIISELAKSKNFKCLLAENGEDGLQLAEKYQPNAIILDVGLPQIDGWTVMERLKDNPDIRHIPVHFVSGTEASQDARKMGAIGYCLKPVSTEGLTEMFNNIEDFISNIVKNLLVVVDSPEHRQAIVNLTKTSNIKPTIVTTCAEAWQRLQTQADDCIVIDVSVEQDTGIQLIEKIHKESRFHHIPVITYAERDLTDKEEVFLQKYANNLIVKPVRSLERLLDETTLFLHQVESKLSEEQRQILHKVRDKEAILNGKVVLIVDDDMRNIFALGTILEGKGMEVIVANDGKEAIKQLSQNPKVAVVLMDIMMPKMDGYEAIRKIRSQPQFRKLPIIALTAKAMKDDKAKCIEIGASDYLPKPLEADKLFSLLRVWLYQ